MAECCATRGFARTTIEDVCSAAGVSRETFEREFSGLEECLGATMQSLVDAAWTALEAVASPGRPWSITLREGAAGLLAMLAERPAFAYVALVDARTADGRAAVLRNSARSALLEFLEHGHELAEAGVPASAASGALAAAEALVEQRVVSGNAGELAELAPAVVYVLAVPFLGMGEADRLAQGARRRRHLRAVA